MVTTGIHIFRKDLRLYDNLALSELYKNVDKIILLFILDNNQIKVNNKNKYYISNNAIQFMIESLDDLNKQSKNKLLILNGNVETIISKLIKNNNISFISFNADYTKYALERDNKIINICKKNKINTIINYDDQTLVNMNNLIKTNQDPYMVFGPFYKNSKKHKVNKPNKIKFDKFYKPKITNDSINYKINNKLAQRGGRTKGLINLNKDGHNISAYLNFGCLSVREVYHKLKNNKNLYWRDYYLCLLRYKQNANSYSKFIDERYNKIKWKNNKKDWLAMIESKTGFLLIDAAMKELLITGFISNQFRLLLGKFWISYLLVNPFDLEYGIQSGFSRYLVDCNTSQNKLNIAWLIGDLDLTGRRFAKKNTNSLTGRMIRIDNEMIKKYDPKGEYIKKWLPELKNKTIKELINYPTIFNWEHRYEEYCKMFKNI